MAVFKRLTKDQIRSQFQYTGLFMGCVPVYVGDPYGDCVLAVRNGWPEWLLDAADALSSVVPGDFYAIKLTGEIS